MSGFNLPPGVSVNDIPGNRPEDARIEQIYEQIDEALKGAVFDSFPDCEKAHDAIFALIEKAYENGYSQRCSDELRIRW